MLFLALTCSALLSFSEDQQWSAFGPVTLAAAPAPHQLSQMLDPGMQGVDGNLGIHVGFIEVYTLNSFCRQLLHAKGDE